MREYYPELALFVTEFGAESNRKGPVERKGTYAFQRELMRHHVRTYIKKRYLNGAIAWILRDFRVRPDWEGGNPTPRPRWNQKGLVDARAQQEARVQGRWRSSTSRCRRWRSRPTRCRASR